MNTSSTTHVEKHLLSLYTCGCYINTQDITTLGHKLGIDLAYKKRSLIMQTLFLHAQRENKKLELLTLLCTLLDTKAKQLLNLSQHYTKTAVLMQHFLFKINTSKLLLQRELALHVKEFSGNN
ncbi:MAG: hypothetical protein PHN18_08040 [Sulfurospirillaceae bacterium]|nr:hypothetical protein [Sulfurospirillaceae bacterium]MDD2827902.1 hypothetical protein [Sulfurospirillaceae bacterium]